MRIIAAILLFVIASLGCSQKDQEMRIPLSDGEYLFEHKFAEAEQHRIKSITLDVVIKGNHITVINNDRDDVFPKGILEEGALMWHTESKQWIIGQKPSDAKVHEVGGCSDGPTVVDLVKHIYWTC